MNQALGRSQLDVTHCCDMKASLSLGFDDLACFVTLADCGSFTAAAAVLRTTKATVSRRMQRLEARLRTQLFVRTTRAVRLTADGATYLEMARRAVEAAQMAEKVLQENRKTPSGVLRITTTPFFGDVVIAPLILEYIARYPDVSIDLELTTQKVDLIARDFDIAIRFGALADSGLISRKIAEAYVGCYSSPAYLEARGTPRVPADLVGHAVVGTPPGGASVTWSFQRAGKPASIVLPARLMSPSHVLALRAAREGHGIAKLPGPIAREAVAAGELVPILEEWAMPLVPVHLVMPRRTPLPARTRAFVDLIGRAAKVEPLASLGVPPAMPPREPAGSARGRARPASTASYARRSPRSG